MDTKINDFETYLREEKKMAENSIDAYMRDIKRFEAFVKQKEINRWQDVNNALVVSYVLYLKEEGKSSSTINRKIASIRSLYFYLMDQNEVEMNPAVHVKVPKVKKKPPEFLSIEEVELLLARPDQSAKGIRDRAILELLYATGMRVSELVDMDVNDVNIKMGFVACNGEHGKTRIIPLGKPAREAMESYLNEVRTSFVRSNQETALFVNYAGERLTRQGLWKIIKHYAEKAGIEAKITPQILRHSFAIHMIQNGADIKSLQELLGHEDVSATQVYLIATRNKIKEVYDKTHPRA